MEVALNENIQQHTPVLHPYKLGDVRSGNWQWAVGAPNRIREKRPLCVATVNFHGSDVAAGLDPEQLAPLFAAAPEFPQALKVLASAVECGPWVKEHQKPLDAALSAIAKAEGKQ